MDQHRRSIYPMWLPLLLLSLSPSLAYAATASTTSTVTATITATGTAPAFPTMSGQDGFGVPAGGVGSNTAGDGASGSDGGTAWSLSTGAIVGIIVGSIVVIAAIVGMWFLWYTAKKRQWTIRESIRRASRRVVGLKNPPRTPRTVAREATAARRTTQLNKKTPTVQVNDVDLERGPNEELRPTPGWLSEKDGSRPGSRQSSTDGESKSSSDRSAGRAVKPGR